MKDITELRDSLIQDRQKMGSGRMKLPLAKERTANANAIINTCKTQLAFFALRKEIPHIPFLGSAKPLNGRVTASRIQNGQRKQLANA